jgi:hypothetical protein
MKRLSCCAALLLLAAILALGASWLSVLLGADSDGDELLSVARELLPAQISSGQRTVAERHCTRQAPLVPRIRLGPPLQRHRHSLELPRGFDRSPYVIVNTRADRAYQWNYQGPNNTADAVFGVPTGYALLHPGWEHDSWELWFDCDPLVQP